MAKDGKRGLTLEQRDFWDMVYEEGEARVLVVSMQIAFFELQRGHIAICNELLRALKAGDHNQSIRVIRLAVAPLFEECKPSNYPGNGSVYFIGAEAGDGSIKIGYTASGHPQGRLSELQVGNASVLELIGYIPNVNRAFEAAAHGFFSGIRIRGEWFQESSIIRAFVAHYGG